ncbi:DUF6382 domain-containing protein [Lachnospiraceae bacterium 46-15]
MEVTYRRDSEHNYMILKSDEKLRGNEYQVRMLLGNEIPGLLHCKLRMVDGEAYFYYEITSRQPLSRILGQRPAGCEDIWAISSGLVRALEGMERYLLAEEGLLLEPDFLYMDVETKEISFCYLPFFQKSFSGAFRELAEYLLKSLNHEDDQAVLWGYQLYSGTVEENYHVGTVVKKLRRTDSSGKNKAVGEEKEVLVREETVSCKETEKQKQSLSNPESLKSPVCRGLTGQEYLKKRRQYRHILWMALGGILLVAGIAGLAFSGVLTLTQAGGTAFLLAAAVFYLAGGKEKKQRQQLQEKRQQRQEERPAEQEMQASGQQRQEREEKVCDFYEEPGEEPYGQTTLFREGMPGEAPVLISIYPEQRGNAVVDQEKFIIGKLKGQVNLILDLPPVSRIHAGIERRDGNYFLTDLNSTNGTFLNGERMEANEYRQLHSGDEVYFAGAGYYFKE